MVTEVLSNRSYAIRAANGHTYIHNQRCLHYTPHNRKKTKIDDWDHCHDHAIPSQNLPKDEEETEHDMPQTRTAQARPSGESTPV